MNSERRYPTYMSIPFYYGVGVGLVSLPFMALLYRIGRHPFLIPAFLDYRILFLSIAIFFSLKAVRDHPYTGAVFFWQALLGAMILIFSFALVAALLLYVYIGMDKDFVQDYIRLSLNQLDTFSQEDIQRIGEETYREGRARLIGANARFMATRFFVQSFIIGAPIAIIMAVFLRRTSLPSQKT